MQNYYEILDVPKNATEEEILEQWRFLCFAFHPDRVKTTSMKEKAEERMKVINKAKDTLTNPEKRSEYDRLLQEEEAIGKMDQDFWEEILRQAANEYPKHSTESSAPNSPPPKQEGTKKELRTHLSYIRNLLEEGKWRLAKDALSVFEGLGKTPDNPPYDASFYCSKDREEWEKASKLNEKAGTIKVDYITILTILSLIIYGVIGAIIGANNPDFAGGAVIIILLGGLVGALTYGFGISGRWGKTADWILGFLMGGVIILAFSFIVFIILAVIAYWIIMYLLNES